MALTAQQRMANLRARKKGVAEPYAKTIRTKPYASEWKPKQPKDQEFIFQDYTSSLSHNEWAEYYCGHSWELEYLDELTQRLWKHYRDLDFLPRGHGKTLRVPVTTSFSL